jgi:hypothetical protein
MCENSFWVENLTVEKKQFAPDASPSPFVKMCCEGIYRSFLANSKGCPCKIDDICIYFIDL